METIDYKDIDIFWSGKGDNYSPFGTKNSCQTLAIVMLTNI